MAAPELHYLVRVLGVENWLSPVSMETLKTPRVSVVVFEPLNPARHELIQKMFAAIECFDYEILEGDITHASAPLLFHFGPIPEKFSADPRWAAGAPSLHELVDEEDPQILKLKKKTAWGALQHLERRFKA